MLYKYCKKNNALYFIIVICKHTFNILYCTLYICVIHVASYLYPILPDRKKYKKK